MFKNIFYFYACIQERLEKYLRVFLSDEHAHSTTQVHRLFDDTPQLFNVIVSKRPVRLYITHKNV